MTNLKEAESYVLNRGSSAAAYEVDQSSYVATEEQQQSNTSSEEENNSQAEVDEEANSDLVYVADDAQSTKPSSFCDDILLCYSFML